MARPANPERAHAVELIRRLTRQHGHVEGPKLARKEFKHVPAPSWSRWTYEAIGDRPAEEVGRKHAEGLAAAAHEQVPQPVDLLRPSLSEVVERGPAIRRAIGFREKLARMEDDAELLASYGTIPTQDGGRKVRNPMALIQANRLRAETMRIELELAHEVWGHDRLKEIMDAIISEVAAESQETAGRILARIRRITDAHRERYGV